MGEDHSNKIMVAIIRKCHLVQWWRCHKIIATSQVVVAVALCYLRGICMWCIDLNTRACQTIKKFAEPIWHKNTTWSPRVHREPINLLSFFLLFFPSPTLLFLINPSVLWKKNSLAYQIFWGCMESKFTHKLAQSKNLPCIFGPRSTFLSALYLYPS